VYEYTAIPLSRIAKDFVPTLLFAVIVDFGAFWGIRQFLLMDALIFFKVLF